MGEIMTVRVPDGEKAKIENIIKLEYPHLKTISDVVRLALTKYLTNYTSQETAKKEQSSETSAETQP
jgi:Arc/MetJ-type ribon-helix-helix transcriptional regulator